MPLLLGIVPWLAAALGGAYVGSQIDDAIDHPVYPTPSSQELNPTKIFIYAAGAMILFWGYKKAMKA